MTGAAAGGGGDVTLIGVVDCGAGAAAAPPGQDAAEDALDTEPAPALLREIELGWAAAAAERQNLVVGMGPAGHTMLAEACDTYLGTACPDEGGVLAISSGGAAGAGLICPTSGIVNNVMMQALHAQFSDELCRLGQVPVFLKGALWSGAVAFNQATQPLLDRRGF